MGVTVAAEKAQPSTRFGGSLVGLISQRLGCLTSSHEADRRQQFGAALVLSIEASVLGLTRVFGACGCDIAT